MRYHMGKKYINYRIRCYIYIFLFLLWGRALGKVCGESEEEKILCCVVV